MNDSTTLVLVVDGYLCIGCLSLNGLRILDILNCPLSDYLTLSDVEIRSIGDVVLTSRTDELVIRKEHLIVAMSASDAHEAPEKRRNSQISKRAYPVLAVAAGCTIRGWLHYNGIFDAKNVLQSGNVLFTPITESQVTFTQTSAENVASATTFVNRRLISMLTLDNSIQGGSATNRSAGGGRTMPAPATDPLDRLLEEIQGRLLETAEK